MSLLSLAESDSFLLLYLPHLLSLEESDSINDESDDDRSDSGSSITCAFTFCFDDSVGHVCGADYGIFFNRNWFQLWCYSVGRVRTNISRVQRWSPHQNILVPKVLIFPPNFKINFIAIFLVWPFQTHSNHCCFAKNMIRRRPMLSVRRNSDHGSGGTKDTKFIWCDDGREPQIHELWCLGLDNITREAHPTAQVGVGAGPVWDFTTDYLDT